MFTIKYSSDGYLYIDYEMVKDIKFFENLIILDTSVIGTQYVDNLEDFIIDLVKFDVSENICLELLYDRKCSLTNISSFNNFKHLYKYITLLDFFCIEDLNVKNYNKYLCGYLKNCSFLKLTEIKNDYSMIFENNHYQSFESSCKLLSELYNYDYDIFLKHMNFVEHCKTKISLVEFIILLIEHKMIQNMQNTIVRSCPLPKLESFLLRNCGKTYSLYKKIEYVRNYF